MYLSNAYAGLRIGSRLRRLMMGGALATLAIGVAPAVASADSASQLTVVGTSDVSDSGLIQNLIQPEFENAYPQFQFKYVGSATGAAIQSAEGTGTTSGPSVLIVHAASLENQFVAGGYSYNNQYGNAVFRNDFILAGPAADPAGVSKNAGDNIAQAFADVAAAGLNGTGTMLTRGGTTTASGTTVEEHAIWGLVNSSGLTPSGVVLCTVSAADGGGMSPIKPTVQSTSGQACPDSGTVNSTDAPSWYVVNTGANQAANVQATNACTVGNKNNTCYVLTDRGTFDYLAADQLQGGASLIPALGDVTSTNSATAPGGADALINYFHVYIINPSAPGESVNLTAAQDFVNFLTSPTLQSQLGNYLKGTGDPFGAPFAPDASPIITGTFPKNVNAGSNVTIKGTVTNAEIGYPVLAGVKVNIDEVEDGVPVVVASGKTTSTGAYSVTFTPKTSGSYEVSTPEISQVENASLSPIYGDILSPGSTAASSVTLVGLPTSHSFVFTSIKTHGTIVKIGATLNPAPALAGTKIELLAQPLAGGGQKKVSTISLGKGKKTFTITANLKKKGTYALQLYYVQKGQVWTYSKLKTVSVK